MFREPFSCLHCCNYSQLLSLSLVRDFLPLCSPWQHLSVGTTPQSCPARPARQRFLPATGSPAGCWCPGDCYSSEQGLAETLDRLCTGGDGGSGVCAISSHHCLPLHPDSPSFALRLITALSFCRVDPCQGPSGVQGSTTLSPRRVGSTEASIICAHT